MPHEALMLDALAVLRSLFAYSDRANAKILDAAAALPDGALDRPFDMGPGSLRRTLVHIHNGEATWLARWIGGAQGRPAEPAWPGESEGASVAELAERFGATAAARDRYLDTLTPADLERTQSYRDSRGSLFRARLADMLLQAAVHSVHHRAQAVNMLRRLGAAAPEVDYMYDVRHPA